MRAVILLLVFACSVVQAENWVYTPDKVEGYDKDSIVRKGVFVEMNLLNHGGARFDCAKKKVMLIDSIQSIARGWYDATETSNGREILAAACSKPWEFWKR